MENIQRSTLKAEPKGVPIFHPQMQKDSTDRGMETVTFGDNSFEQEVAKNEYNSELQN